MSDKLEIGLRIQLDRAGLERRLGKPVEDETAFFILGLVQAQLCATYGDENCTVEMEAATGIHPELVRAMNSFARRHRQVMNALEANGEVIVEDRDVVEVLQIVQNVVITPVGSRWHVTWYPATVAEGGRSN